MRVGRLDRDMIAAGWYLYTDSQGRVVATATRTDFNKWAVVVDPDGIMGDRVVVYSLRTLFRADAEVLARTADWQEPEPRVLGWERSTGNVFYAFQGTAEGTVRELCGGHAAPKDSTVRYETWLTHRDVVNEFTFDPRTNVCPGCEKAWPIGRP